MRPPPSDLSERHPAGSASRPDGSVLPPGFRVRLAADTKVCDDGRTLVGGSGAVLHLRPRARTLLHDRTLVAVGSDAATVARLLLDRGLADPVFDSAPSDDAVTDVTVVIPVRDRPRQLARLLAALPPRLPVLVVDDGSEEARTTRAVATEFGATVLRHPVSRGPAAARNTGLGRVRTDLVAFLDSDVVPEPGWLGRLRRHLDDPAVGIVGPRVLGSALLPGDGWLARYEAVRSSLDLGPRPGPVRPLSRVAYLPSAALLVRRSALAGGGFDDTMPVAEDVDLVWRVHSAGWRVRYEPASVVRHDHRTTLGPWLRRKAFYGTGAALLADRHGSDVAPLVLNPWTAALTVAVLAQRRWSLPVVALVCAGVTASTSRRLTAGDHPLRTAASLTALGAVSSLQQVGSALTRHYWPLALVAATRSPRARRALLVASVADTVLDHRRARPDLDPVRFGVARRLDDLAYGTGLWLGAVRARSPRALVPALRGFPFRRGTS